MLTFLSSDSDNDSTNSDDGEGVAEPFSSPPLTTDVNSPQLSFFLKENLLQMFGNLLV